LAKPERPPEEDLTPALRTVFCQSRHHIRLRAFVHEQIDLGDHCREPVPGRMGGMFGAIAVHGGVGFQAEKFKLRQDVTAPHARLFPSTARRPTLQERRRW
jgi:hypothetical protein